MKNLGKLKTVGRLEGGTDQEDSRDLGLAVHRGSPKSRVLQERTIFEEIVGSCKALARGFCTIFERKCKLDLDLETKYTNAIFRDPALSKRRAGDFLRRPLPDPAPRRIPGRAGRKCLNLAKKPAVVRSNASLGEPDWFLLSPRSFKTVLGN